MTNVEFYIGIAIPIIAVIASVTVSLIQISAIREDLREIRRGIRDIHSDISKLLDGKKP